MACLHNFPSASNGGCKLIPFVQFGLLMHLHICDAYVLYPGEKLIGARAYRVMFALVSLPLATVALVYFINHR